ncbi:MAG: LysM peptidoglycan-binding domain-containing protein [Firmicutes bacterium]|nr:LysM peptidoglycan-binding domain-containing protein [Bacillota bacterium]
MFDYYRIQKGDTIESIANKFKTEESVLKEINNIYLDELRVGMDIIVPKNKEMYFNYYTIEAGDSLYQIARKYNINPNLLASLNGLNMDAYIYPNQEIMIPKSGFSYYLTSEGDTIDTVAKMFNVSKDTLVNENETIYLLADQVLVAKRK